jgi:curved DNA-binding protein CbpA
MELYELLGCKPTDTFAVIRRKFRSLSKKAHPDVGGDPEHYKKLTEAHEILTDPEKRKRYDQTGRTDKSVTKEKIREYIQAIFNNVVNVDPPPDDPVWDNILHKVIMGIVSARSNMKADLQLARRKLQRTRVLLKRFKPLQEEDPVGDELRRQEDRWQSEIRRQEDSIELSQCAEEVLRGYRYEVGPDPEGQDESDPTVHLTSGGVLRIRTGR